MVTIQFINVGRGHKTWTAELKDASEDTIAGEAGKALLSRGVCAEDGTIYAGCRPAGRYVVLPAQKSLSV